MQPSIFTVTTGTAFVLMMQKLRLIASEDEATKLWENIVSWFEKQPEIVCDILFTTDPELQIKFGSSYILVHRYGDMYDFQIPKSINCDKLIECVQEAALVANLPFPSFDLLED